ncbi:hypothetical protein ACQZ4Q_01365 [Agrobacterium vitis]|uniref:Uncharacterized protein n=1 Tax=Allorhizobium ampelinum (strain ATCC BAA-846 / DSM 112012 / S4) TaxID=311402 RepID=B9K2Q3_ALLAM|nr:MULTISPECIES: hypothetical protein [Rhizobium/Agrobacterium group]ACM39151.1 hypothetical protein Avi_6155 [Allorhizobium ampelinum S4]MUO30817.1 hypothetical protein [Agrobacterium vitis]
MTHHAAYANRPTDAELRTMAAARMTTADIAAHCGCGKHSARKWMNAAGCQSDRQGGWNIPSLDPAQPAPKPTGKSVLEEQFPFIRTHRVKTITGTIATLPAITMQIAYRESVRGGRQAKGV